MNTIRWKKRVVAVVMTAAAVTLIFTFAHFNGIGHKETHAQSGHERKETYRAQKPTNRAGRATEKALQRNFQAVATARDSHHHMKQTPDHFVEEKKSRTIDDVKPRDKDVKSRDQDSRLHRLRDHALKLNIEEKVLNLEKFFVLDENGDFLPPVKLDKNGIILAVQVHNRSEYFVHFVSSLKSVKNIEQALLVISHDYYSPEMERLVASIDICKVVQIFYPYSMQLYPAKFPGQDPNDCPRDMSKQIAKQSGCNNADHPDQYGHYREAKFTMTKHHWWWKAHHIFDHMRLTHGFEGSVVFLEEDHYLSPDFLHMVNKMAAAKPNICPKCDFIGLGVYDKPKLQRGAANAVQALPWESGKHNMGFAMNRDSWNVIKGCNKLFCDFDDYNWDWTLQSLGRRCLNRPIGVLIVQVPRVFHIGQCGVHHKVKPGTTQCDAKTLVSSYQQILQENNQYFFPDEVYLSSSSSIAFTTRMANPKGYGGWGDVRDHELCFSYINASHILPPSS